MTKVRFGDYDLHSVSCFEGNRKEGKLLAVPFRKRRDGVDVLEGVAPLLLESSLGPDIRDPCLQIAGEVELGLLSGHIESAFPVSGDEAVGDSVVVGAELEGAVLEIDCQEVVDIVDIFFLVDDRPDSSVFDASGPYLADLALAEHSSVLKGHRDSGGSKNLLSVVVHRICHPVDSAYLHRDSGIGRIQNTLFLCRMGHERKGQHCKKCSEKTFHIHFFLC